MQHFGVLPCTAILSFMIALLRDGAPDGVSGMGGPEAARSQKQFGILRQ